MGAECEGLGGVRKKGCEGGAGCEAEAVQAEAVEVLKEGC